MMRGIKLIGKSLLSAVLEHQVKQLRRKHSFQLIAVAGSVGKTSTKSAIAAMLGATHSVRYQAGNYNDRLTVPLVIFGVKEPKIFDLTAWLGIILQNRRQIHGEYPYEYVVVELGTDGSGQMRHFAYLAPEIGVLTAIAPEHIEQFGSLDAVAQEELVLGSFAKTLLVNADDCAPDYLSGLQYEMYGLGDRLDGLALPLLGEQGAKICLGAVAVARLLGLSEADIAKGVQAIKPVAGRMQLLVGKQGSTLIDDTYNASPISCKAALDVLTSRPAPQHIAILGSMNELGDYSPEAHREVGVYCNPATLDLVVTIGAMAETYLAPAAIAEGCKVVSCKSPYEAGRAVAAIMQPKSVVLAKGSQNGVFAEEALKVLLADTADSQKLVRQSAYWLAVKTKQFPDL